jgi:NADH dehydrogenase/NADH:ubiquinone oxidoreductase subunit G
VGGPGLARGGPADVDDATAAALARARTVVIAANQSALSDAAEVILPASSFAEIDGSYVNRQGREQRLHAGPAPAGESRPGWEIVVRLARTLGHPLRWTKLADVRHALAGAPALSSEAAAATPAE